MSQYTTGEIARLCGVTVRTVQYYDTRGILVPRALSEGGRRLYSEDDVRKLKIICFLREIGLSIDTIGSLLAEPEPGNVVLLLLEQQRQALSEELRVREEQIQKIDELMRSVRQTPSFSIESIGDVAYIMNNRKELQKVHRLMLLTGLPVTALQWAAIILTAIYGWWWMLIVWAAVAVPWGVWISRYYYLHVAYICPQCHETFRPALKEMLFAPHTTRTRKLTCTNCCHHGFCVEVAAPKNWTVKKEITK
ncbi:MAG: MerR family transcriptional regulator [Clostridia bacterium]|nr:MerR family transcriptional regulator [Clostridia bacterium]